MLADKGYDADGLRDALAKRNISACIAARAKGRHPAVHDVRLYTQRQDGKHVRALAGLETYRDAL